MSSRSSFWLFFNDVLSILSIRIKEHGICSGPANQRPSQDLFHSLSLCRRPVQAGFSPSYLNKYICHEKFLQRVDLPNLQENNFNVCLFLKTKTITKGEVTMFGRVSKENGIQRKRDIIILMIQVF